MYGSEPLLASPEMNIVCTSQVRPWRKCATILWQLHCNIVWQGRWRKHQFSAPIITAAGICFIVSFRQSAGYAYEAVLKAYIRPFKWGGERILTVSHHTKFIFSMHRSSKFYGRQILLRMILSFTSVKSNFKITTLPQMYCSCSSILTISVDMETSICCLNFFEKLRILLPQFFSQATIRSRMVSFNQITLVPK